jgi:hypothetical protein
MAVVNSHSSSIRSAAQWVGAGAALAAGAYAAYVGVAWARYGHAARPHGDDEDRLLDRFMPTYDVAERHHITVAAPAHVTLAAAREFKLGQQPVVRGIFKARQWLLGSAPDQQGRPQGLLAEVRALGWVVLEEIPHREIVVGAVTRPWEANVTFRSIPADQFAAFQEPGYVKIVWTLGADPIDTDRSTFRTETRAVATDAVARNKFRRYWSLLSPGIILIRWAALKPVKTAAERQAQRAPAAGWTAGRV